MSQGFIKLTTISQRALPIIPAILLTFGSFWAFCWFFGNSVADKANQVEIAEYAVSLAPDDPLAHATLSLLKTQSFVSSDLSVASAEAERAAALAPHDWRFWFALCRTRERMGDAKGAESAARRGAVLAPNYTQVRWLLGNVLLRHGANRDEAIAEMRRAAEADASIANSFVSLTAQILNTEDLEILKRTVGESVPVRTALIFRLAQNKKMDAALGIWQTLPENVRRETGKALANVFFDAKKYRSVLPIFQLAITNEIERPVLGRILNSGFESPLAAAGNSENVFGWQIADGAQPQIGPNSEHKHGGERSLFFCFNSLSGADFRPVSQFVTVESKANYHFEVFAKSANLKTGATVFWEIVDEADGRILGKTQTVATGDSDWRKLTADFTTTGETEGIRIRLANTLCTQPPCAVTGKVWFDDFSLQNKIKRNKRISNPNFFNEL